MCADKKFNVKSDPAAARLAARNKKSKENPQPGVQVPRQYDRDKG